MWYKLTLTPDDDGTWLVTAPEFPEVTSFGDNQEDALRHGREAIEEAIARRIAAGEDIPFPEPAMPGRGFHIQIPALVVLKSALYMNMRAKGWTRADLMRALGCKREHVDRLFRLDHNSRLGSLEDAFAALGIPMRIDVPFATAA
ncbi:MAG TPA: type II toxin-antitoxin system HicB family antitoxin [Bauldia sp.]|nr:type II toxin-antitoxin system HicB family antitoxin [Bauldia sp.]